MVLPINLLFLLPVVLATSSSDGDEDHRYVVPSVADALKSYIGVIQSSDKTIVDISNKHNGNFEPIENAVDKVVGALERSSRVIKKAGSLGGADLKPLESECVKFISDLAARKDIVAEIGGCAKMAAFSGKVARGIKELKDAVQAADPGKQVDMGLFVNVDVSLKTFTDGNCKDGGKDGDKNGSGKDAGKDGHDQHSKQSPSTTCSTAPTSVHPGGFHTITTSSNRQTFPSLSSLPPKPQTSQPPVKGNTITPVIVPPPPVTASCPCTERPKTMETATVTATADQPATTPSAPPAKSNISPPSNSTTPLTRPTGVVQAGGAFLSSRIVVLAAIGITVASFWA